MTEAVHAAGGRIFLQIWHTGRISHPSLQPGGARPVAPSPIQPAGEAVTYEGMQHFVTPRALATEEIAGIVAAFRQAAVNAEAAGFDGVEVHAANGYLLDQFLRDGTNRRTDAYGGPVENRARLLFDVLNAVVEVWGAEKVGVRLSPTNNFNDIRDSDPDGTFGYVVERMNRYGLAYLHVVENAFGTDAHAQQSYDRRALRETFDGVYIANGGYDRERAEIALAHDDADLVAFGQLFIANPDLPKRFAVGADLNAPDPGTFYGGDARGYTDYPSLDRTPAVRAA